MSIADDLARSHGELIRRAVLELLAASVGGEALDPALHTALEALDMRCTRDQLRGHLTWLAEQQLVSVRDSKSGHVLACLTERGADVARGAAAAPGVSRKAFGS